MKWEHSAGLIPFTEKDGQRQYLLLLSALTKSELWEFPKGLIEKQEDALSAASREMWEETGIREWEIIPGFKKVLKYFYRRNGDLIGKTVTYFLARVKSQSVTLSRESKAHQWLTLKEALSRIKHKNIRELLLDAERYVEPEKSKAK